MKKKNTLKKTLTKSKTQKNNKELVNKCMDTFVKNRVNKRLSSFDKNVYELNKMNPSTKYINEMKKTALCQIYSKNKERKYLKIRKMC